MKPRTSLDLLSLMESVMGVLSRHSRLEDATNELFLLLREHIPVRFLLLGFFDLLHDRSYVLSVTDGQGTQHLGRYFAMNAAQKERINGINFIASESVMVDFPDHPLNSLYAVPELALEPPYYVSCFSPAHMQQGAGTFGLEPGEPLSPDFDDIMRALRLPLNIFVTNQFRYWELEQVNRMIEEDNARLRKEALGLGQTDIIGANGGLKGVVERLRQVAPLDVTLLMQGETGTGKEVLARAAHELSIRRKGAFIALNCGAIPPSLIDSELFGHAKGSFTGAASVHRGRFERASGGTLFLDEVGELPLEAQARLLRVLEERVVERVGGGQAIPVDFRLVAATHRDLRRMVDEGHFREDLYYRLAVVPLFLPPLRDRKQDIPVLARHFVARSAHRFGVLPPEIPPQEFARLCEHHWPGNVRELQNVVEEAMAFSLSGVFHFWPNNASQPVPRQGNFVSQGEIMLALAYDEFGDATHDAAGNFLPHDAMMHRYLRNALAHCHGKIQGPGGVASLLEIHPNTLRTKLDKYGVPYGRKG